MELDFTFRNLEPSDAIKEWAMKRFKKVEKYLRGASHAHLTIIVDKHRHRAEVTIHHNGDLIRCAEESNDMYGSLDSVMGKVEQAAQRLKERESVRQAHHEAWRGGER
jgi:putative sigma-54 modulation protein